MTGAILRHEVGGGFVVDTLIIAGGLGLMIALARFLDARKTPPAKKHEPSEAPMPASIGSGCTLVESGAVDRPPTSGLSAGEGLAAFPCNMTGPDSAS